jgi:ceramide glucosyltransferase
MSDVSFWRATVMLLAVAPLAYYLVAIFAALRFFSAKRDLHPENFTPPASLLKPVRGVDFATYENFRSFCTLDYPEYETLFCVNEMNDPAVPVIERLKREFPNRRIEIFFGAEQIGSNRKVNNLALLTKQARNEILVQSDGDIRVGPNYLREVVAPFANPAVGVVSCFYRGVAEENFWAEMEAIGAASDFFAGALVANLPGSVTFALGASVVTTRTWLEKIGGYQALADLLADDYEIGNRIHKSGGKVLLSQEGVWTMYPAQTFCGFWEHQVRWSRTVRIVRPVSFLGLIFTHGLPLSVLAAIAAPATWLSASFLGAYLVLRLLMAWVVGVWGVKDEVLAGKLWLVPLRDALHFAVWLAGFTSNRVKWGGAEFKIEQGRMKQVPPARN